MKFIVTFLLLFLLISCENSSEIIPQKNELIPFKMGNQWAYKSKIENITIISRYKITGDTVINDQLWYNYNFVGVPNYMNYFEDGIYELYWVDTLTAKSSLKFKYPAQKGETYKYLNKIKVTVISINSEIEVEAGKFWCYVYEFLYDSSKENYYIAPGVGIVKRESIDFNENGDIEEMHVEELMEYILN